MSGYTVSNQVRITVRDVKRLGEILDQAISLGANQMHGIAFEVSTAETLKDDARKPAMQNARRRAEFYATAAGAQLGPVLRIAEKTYCDAGGPMLQRAAWRWAPCRSRPAPDARGRGARHLRAEVKFSFPLEGGGCNATDLARPAQNRSIHTTGELSPMALLVGVRCHALIAGHPHPMRPAV